LDDGQLVAAALAGSESACGELVRRYEAPVFRLLARLVRDEALAEDLAQETFVKAFRALGSYDPGRRLVSWLFKIAHNTAIDHLRRRRPAELALEGVDEEDPGFLGRLSDPSVADPEATVRGGELLRDFERALGELGPIYRELVLLRFQEGLEYGEIADVTGLPMGTVKVRLHRARKRLAEALRGRGWEAPR